MPFGNLLTQVRSFQWLQCDEGAQELPLAILTALSLHTLQPVDQLVTDGTVPAEVPHERVWRVVRQTPLQRGLSHLVGHHHYRRVHFDVRSRRYHQHGSVHLHTFQFSHVILT